MLLHLVAVTSASMRIFTEARDPTPRVDLNTAMCRAMPTLYRWRESPCSLLGDIFLRTTGAGRPL